MQGASMAAVDIIVLLVAALGLAYFQVAAWLWIVTFGLLLVLTSILGSLSGWILIIFWVVFLVAATLIEVKTFRLRYFTYPLIKKLSQHMPTISATEREALESGDVWFEKDLFCGRPDWNKLHAMPTPKLSSEEQ